MILLENIELLVFFIIMLIMVVVAVIISFIAYGKYTNLERRYEIFMTGKDAESLEEFFINLQENLDKMEDINKKNTDVLRVLNRTIKKTYQKAGIYKYDAFEEKMGRRSFALALLDYTNTGFVITFQNTNDGTQVFVKNIEAGATNIKLGPEEEKAVKIALGEEQ